MPAAWRILRRPAASWSRCSRSWARARPPWSREASASSWPRCGPPRRSGSALCWWAATAPSTPRPTRLCAGCPSWPSCRPAARTTWRARSAYPRAAWTLWPWPRMPRPGRSTRCVWPRPTASSTRWRRSAPASRRRPARAMTRRTQRTCGRACARWRAPSAATPPTTWVSSSAARRCARGMRLSSSCRTCPISASASRSTPGADPSDGRLEAILIEARGRRRLLRLLAAARRGRHIGRSGVRRVSAGRARLTEPLPLVADAVPLGVTTATVSVEPARLRVASPHPEASA